jgi:hypothetical protein
VNVAIADVPSWPSCRAAAAQYATLFRLSRALQSEERDAAIGERRAFLREA